MKNFKIVFCLILSLFLSNCASKHKSLESASGDIDLPSWVGNANEGIKDGIAGVGIAPLSKGGLKFQIPNAELSAKANIAATIQSDITRVTKNSLRSAKVNEEDDVEEFFAQATKEVVNEIPLSGVKTINTYIAKDGTLYLRMLLTGEDYSQYLLQGKNKLKDRLRKSSLSRTEINEVEKSAKTIFDELEKERNKSE